MYIKIVLTSTLACRLATSEVLPPLDVLKSSLMKWHILKLSILRTLVREAEIKTMKNCSYLSRNENLNVVIGKEWSIA